MHFFHALGSFLGGAAIVVTGFFSGPKVVPPKPPIMVAQASATSAVSTPTSSVKEKPNPRSVRLPPKISTITPSPIVVLPPSTDTPFVANNPPVQVRDSNLKIAQCQAKRDSEYSKFVAEANMLVEQNTQNWKAKEQEAINNSPSPADLAGDQKYYDPTISPDANIQMSNIYMSAYKGNIDRIRAYVATQIDQFKEKVGLALTQGKSIIDSDYYKCVS